MYFFFNFGIFRILKSQFFRDFSKSQRNSKFDTKTRLSIPRAIRVKNEFLSLKKKTIDFWFQF